MSSSSLLNAQFFIKLIVFHVQIIDLVLVEGLFVQAASEALLDILHSQPLLLKLLLSDLELYLILTKLLLLPPCLVYKADARIMCWNLAKMFKKSENYKY